MKISRNSVPRRRRDQRFSPMKPESHYRSPPNEGRIRVICDALGMFGTQLGQHMGVKAQCVANIEKSKASGPKW